MTRYTRRSFFRSASAAAAPLLGGLSTQAAALTPAAPPTPMAALPGDGSAPLQWLEGREPALHTGSSWGLPWPRGRVRADQGFVLRDARGQVLPMQSWPLAYWPDGSLKWSAHALPADAVPGAQASVLPLGPKDKPQAPSAGPRLRITQDAQRVVVDTGVLRCELARAGRTLIRSVQRAGVEILRAGELVAQADDQPDSESGQVRQQHYVSEISQLSVEQQGPLRAVVKIEGWHVQGERRWLPFVLRLYFHAGAESLRVMHSFVFDGDEHKDFLRGLGLRFAVPLRDAPHDRHVRFAGEPDQPGGGGIWGEAVRNLTGLRRDPGAAVRAAQVAGQACPPLEQWGTQVRRLHHRVPVWGDYSLAQLSPDAFQIRKRTQPGHGWIDAAWGRRAPGLGYIGGASGGVAFGLRDFWQRHPTQLDIRAAHTEAAEVTLWMHSPQAPAMDLRFYHDGLGMETHEQELEGLEMTYEDYEKGYGSPLGVGRSSELWLWALAATPSRERLVQMAAHVQTPPQLVSTPAHYLASGVFGGLWSLPDRSTPFKAAIEERLDFVFDFYRRETEQRRWYGFWDYGDIRHTYDADRHEWRYDVGGYAWDNSELSPDLWLWFAFLRSGRADIFRFAEAMVRHTSEVDTYHLGRFKGLGTRHNVQHWGCSAKQVRISTAAYRRFYYYLSADERIGDIMGSLLEVDLKLNDVDPVRKLAQQPPKGDAPSRLSFGTDWASLAANWLTDWERRGAASPVRAKLLRGMQDLGRLPHGLFSAERAGYDPATGAISNLAGQRASASHLNAVFGAVEIFAELIQLTGDKGFEAAWLQYCELINAPREEQVRALGMPHGVSNALVVGHSRLTAYAAWRKRDPALAQRAWKEFMTGDRFGREPLVRQHVAGAAVLRPIEEAPWISTNAAAQWGLAAIQNLALIGEQAPA
jgi:hypothetical protein